MEFNNKEELIDNVTAMVVAFIVQIIIALAFIWIYRWWWGQIILALMASTTLMCPVLIIVTVHDYVKNHRNK